MVTMARIFHVDRFTYRPATSACCQTPCGTAAAWCVSASHVRRCEKGQFCTACASQYPRPSLPGPSTCSNCFSRPTYAQCSTFQAIGPARPQRGPAIAQSRSASPPSARPSAAPQYASHGGRYWEPRGPHHPPRQAAVRAPLPPRPSARPARSPSPIGVASDGAPSTGPPAPRARTPHADPLPFVTRRAPAHSRHSPLSTHGPTARCGCRLGIPTRIPHTGGFVVDLLHSNMCTGTLILL